MGLRVNSPPKLNRVKIKTGTYLGNGADNRSIDIGVDLAAKSNPYVIIKANANYYAVHRTEHGQGDLTMEYRNVADGVNFIQQFNNSGFEIGSASSVNADGTVYTYIAIWDEL